LIALPAFLIAYTCNGILQAQGDAVSMQRALIIAFLLNLVLNPLLIFGIPGFWSGLGFDGIALSTIFSQYFVMIFMLYKLINARIKINLSFESLRINYKVLKEIFIQMLPPSLSFQMIIIGVLVMQYALKDFGSQAIAGHSVAMRLEQLILLPVLGMTHALLPLVAQNFGANKYDRVRQSFNLCLKVAIGSMVICYPIIWVFGESVISLFTKNEDVINIGVIYLRIDGLILPVYALIFSINSFLQAVKRPYGVFFVGLFRQGFGIAFFIWVFISVYNFGILGVWLGASVSVILGGVLSLIIAYRVGRIEIGGLWLNTKAL
jgi:Na+-driven multidrug efflux pump